MRKPRVVDPDPAVQQMLQRIYTARTLADVTFSAWESLPIPRSVALEARVALAEVMIADDPPVDARELQRWKVQAAKIRRDLDAERRLEASPGRARDARLTWDYAKQRWEDAYAEYSRLVDAGRAIGAGEDDAT